MKMLETCLYLMSAMLILMVGSPKPPRFARLADLKEVGGRSPIDDPAFPSGRASRRSPPVSDSKTAGISVKDLSSGIPPRVG
jgi:hypothetical protein